MKMSRTESALGTPFFAPEGLISGLVETKLSYSSAGEVFEAEPLHRPKVVSMQEENSIDFLKLDIEIDPKQIQTGLNQLGFGKTGVELLVVARIPMLKRFTELLRLEVNGSSAKKISYIAPPEVLPFVNLARTSTVTISVYLIIKHLSKASIFFPPPPGTWLAGMGYKLLPPQSSFDFTPIPLDDNEAKRLKIPTSSFVFVEFLDDEVDQPLLNTSEVSSALRVYVNSHVLDELVKSSNNQARTTLVAAIRSAAVSQIIYELSIELAEYSHGWDELKSSKSLASTVVEGISDRTLDEDSLLGIIRTHPLRAIAMADAHLETALDMSEGL
jgi:hypothetical protein